MGQIKASYTPTCDRHYRFKDEDGRDFPRWMRNICLGAFREQGWNAYAQPSGKKIGGGNWGDRVLLLRDGTITTDEAMRQPTESTL